MLASLLILAAANAASACAVPPPEVQRQASLAYAAFDSQPPPYGWRQLNAGGCTDAAVALLTAYAAAQAGALSPSQTMEVSFHIGQVLAMAGRDHESIAHFERALGAAATSEWKAYVEATLAFLRRDAAALKAAREAYATLAPKSMRLQFIDGFVACPRETYVKAVHCRP